MAASFCRRSFLNYKNCLFQTQKRTGYVVLIPETPEEVAKCNIDSAENLPDFVKLNASSCHLIVTSLGQQYDVGSWELKQFLEKTPTDLFKYVFDPLEVLSVPYWSAWGVTRAMHYSDYNLMPHNKFLPLSDMIMAARSEKYNSLALYNICKEKLQDKNSNYTEEQKRILKKFVAEGEMNGFELNDEQRKILAQKNVIQEAKKNSYENKLKNAKLGFQQFIDDKNFASENPSDLLRNTAVDFNKPLEGPWIITLYNAVYYRFLEYCPSRDSRLHCWASFNQLCSSRGDSRLNATQDFVELRKARMDYAKLLGYPSYAHLAVKNKMAGSVENVENFLNDLLEPAKYAHEKELYELEKFAFNNDFKSSLEMWDFYYWKRLHLKNVLGLDEEVLKNYFPLSQVLLGLIALCEELFGILIEDQPDIETWRADVRYFRITDAKSKKILGGFYFDPYAREGKFSRSDDSGWFVAMRSKSTICNSLPLSTLIFNFSPPDENVPSLLYPREVEFLFDKFGQMLQHTLTEMNYSEVSGLSNIEWDAMSVCRYFMMNWLQEKGTVESISGHYDTGEPLPNNVLDNLCNIKKHMAGTWLCRRIYLSNLDLELHKSIGGWKNIMNNVWSKHLLFQLVDLDHHPIGFQDIVSGPWGGSYYGDLWSQMLAADIFMAFKEAGFNNQEEMKNLGRRFKSTFLALGGGCDPKEVFRRFRGRDPNHKLFPKLLDLKDPIELPSVAPKPEGAPEPAVA